jgi:hypothetical protein
MRRGDDSRDSGMPELARRKPLLGLGLRRAALLLGRPSLRYDRWQWAAIGLQPMAAISS